MTGNKPGTPYEPCFTPLGGRTRRTPLLEHWSAPKEVWDEVMSDPEGSRYRVSAIYVSDDHPTREGTVSQRALGGTVDLWSRLEGVYCVVVQPL